MWLDSAAIAKANTAVGLITDLKALSAQKGPDATKKADKAPDNKKSKKKAGSKTQVDTEAIKTKKKELDELLEFIKKVLEKGEVVVSATFSLGGQVFDDVNPSARSPSIKGPTIKGARRENTDQASMHAEFGAMFQAYAMRLRGGHGDLKIMGKIACPICKGDVKTMARALDLDSLKVTNADGSVVMFANKRELLPVKQGGKGWGDD